MKLYLALNEGGTVGDIALHTKLAVLSAQKNTKLKPHLLYTGNRNIFTEWMEERGVKTIDSALPYMAVIEKLTSEGRYSTATVGHWLRTNVCLEEHEEQHVFYTDVDVLYLSDKGLEDLTPRYFAAAPEFDKNSWNYFNAGVMVVNPKGLREDYNDFEKYLINNISEKTYHFNDQGAYNIFYKGRWDRLPLEFNWKPYWGINADAKLLHFHGPKVGAITAILEDRWDWSSNHGQQIGSMFVAFYDSYLNSFDLLKPYISDLNPQEQDFMFNIFIKSEKFEKEKYIDKVSTEFMNFRMFPE